jgi:hypothetical protein
MPPAILIMMVLKMGPWADDKDKKPEDTKYAPMLFTAPDKWYQTWWAAAGFTLLLLVGIFGLIFVTGYLLGYR